MDWRKGSYINQYYKNNENLLTRSLVEDIEIFMVENFEGFLKWYDNVLILELKFKLLNESKNYRTNLTDDARFRISEKVVNEIVHTYNNRYKDVERNISHRIEQHKENLEYYRGYGHYGYFGRAYLHPIILPQFQDRRI
jgi:hypothetical protein